LKPYLIKIAEHFYRVLTPGLLQKNVKKSPGIFPGLVVFFGVFFRKFAKIANCYSSGVSTVP